MPPPPSRTVDLREALLRGISETGVPTIETDWVPPAKQSQIAATFTKIAKPTLQCMFEPAEAVSSTLNLIPYVTVEPKAGP